MDRAAMKRIVSESNRGAALLMVLIFLIVIANLGIVALRSSASEARAAAVFVDAARADELGKTIVSLTRYFISADVGHRARGGAFKAAFNVGDVTVEYRSEAARADVNRSPPELLAAILAAVGLEPDRIADIMARLDERRDTAHPTPYRSPFEVTDDWRLSPSESSKIIPLLTTANPQGHVDPLLAAPAMLYALLQESGEREKQFEEDRRNGMADEATALSYFSEPTRKWLAVDNGGSQEAIRASAEVITHRGLRRKFEAVFDFHNEGDDGKIYYWRPVH